MDHPLKGVAWHWGRAVLALLLLAGLGLMHGCNRQPAPPPAREPVHLIAPVYIIADIARQIGGERVDAQWWVEKGQSLGDLQETPQRRNQVRNADIVISRGLLDPWTLENLGNEFEAHRVIRLDQLPSARDLDPAQYVWLDPNVALELSDEILQRLAVQDPRNEKMFRANAAAFREKLLADCDRVRPTMDAARGGFMSLDPGFFPLAHRFGLNSVRVESINLHDPSAYGVKVLRQTAGNSGAGAIFVNDDTPAPLVRDWQEKLGVPVLSLDALGSSASGSGHGTYLQVLEYNLDQLAKGMKASTRPTTTRG